MIDMQYARCLGTSLPSSPIHRDLTGRLFDIFNAANGGIAANNMLAAWLFNFPCFSMTFLISLAM